MFWLISPSDEEKRVRAAQKGDPRAFEELMQQYERTIYGIALRMSGNACDAQDLMQEAMLRIYRHIGSFKGNAKFSTWVFRVTTNVCLDAFRRKRPEQSMESLSESGMQFESPDSPEKHRERSELAESIQAAIGALPEDLRVAVILRDIQGFAYDEIADITGANPGTVKSRISRGRSKIRETLSLNGMFDIKGGIA